jgi:hypothetical protein
MPRGKSPYDEARLQRQLLRPEQLARRLPAVGFWYSADRLTLSGTAVTGATDLAGKRDGTSDANRLTYFPSDPMFGGRASFGSTVLTGTNRLISSGAAATYRHVFVSAYYKDGLDTTFDDSTMFFGGTGAQAAPRMMGQATLASLIASSTFSTTASKGGAAQSATVLPLPATVMMQAGNSSFTPIFGGTSVIANRNLVGAFRHCVGVTAVLTAPEIAVIEGVIAWDDGTQERLVASHPFRNRPPLIGD